MRRFPKACPCGPCPRPGRTGRSHPFVASGREGMLHAELSVARRVRRGGRSRIAPNRGCRYGRGRLRRARAEGSSQYADARHELEPVRHDVRRLHGGLVSRTRGLRILPERRRCRVCRSGRRRRSDADREDRARERHRKGHELIPGRRARTRPGGQRHQGRRPAFHERRGRHVQARRQARHATRRSSTT